jgi:hypothetical protein
VFINLPILVVGHLVSCSASRKFVTVIDDIKIVSVQNGSSAYHTLVAGDRSFARSNTGIMGSNPTLGMDVCVRLFYIFAVLCAGSDLATD